MANTIAVINPRFHNDLNPGVSPLVRGDFANTGTESYLKETASQTYKAGDIVYLDGSGTVAIGALTSSQLSSAIAGFANAAATGVTGTPVQIQVPRASDVYVASVWHATAASAVTVQTQLGSVFALRYDAAALAAGTAGKWVVDIQNTTIEDGTTALARVKVIGFYEGRVPTTTAGVDVAAAIGDIYGRVLINFLSFSIASDATPFTRILQLS